MDEDVQHFEGLAEQQGWNEQTMLGLVMEFISRNQLNEQLFEFAKERADAENAGDGTNFAGWLYQPLPKKGG